MNQGLLTIAAPLLAVADHAAQIGSRANLEGAHLHAGMFRHQFDRVTMSNYIKAEVARLASWMQPNPVGTPDKGSY